MLAFRGYCLLNCCGNRRLSREGLNGVRKLWWCGVEGGCYKTKNKGKKTT